MKTQHADWRDEMLMPSQAAALLGVSTDTLKRWASAGRISVVRLPSGHRRFRRGDIDALLTHPPQKAAG